VELIMDAYRAAPQEPQFICIVCYENLAPTPRDCPRCAVPMQPLDDPAVQEELRSRAEKKKQRINGRRVRITMIASLIIGFGLNALLMWKGVYYVSDKGRTVHESGGAFYFFWFLVPVLMSSVAAVILETVIKRLNLFSATATINPAKASTPDLLVFLGLRDR
jgi:hypothetical protein